MLEAKIRVQAEMDENLANSLKEFMTTYRIKKVNAAVRELMRIGIDAVANIHKVRNPEQVDKLIKEFEEGSIVDYIGNLDRKQFDVLWSIMLNEKSVRYGKNERIVVD